MKELEGIGYPKACELIMDRFTDCKIAGVMEFSDCFTFSIVPQDEKPVEIRGKLFYDYYGNGWSVDKQTGIISRIPEDPQPVRDSMEGRAEIGKLIYSELPIYEDDEEED